MRALTKGNLFAILLLPAFLLILQPLSLALLKSHTPQRSPLRNIQLIAAVVAPSHCSSSSSNSNNVQPGADSILLAFLTKLSNVKLSLTSLPVSKFFLYLILISIGIAPVYRLFKPPR